MLNLFQHLFLPPLPCGERTEVRGYCFCHFEFNLVFVFICETLYALGFALWLCPFALPNLRNPKRHPIMGKKMKNSTVSGRGRTETSSCKKEIGGHSPPYEMTKKLPPLEKLGAVSDGGTEGDLFLGFSIAIQQD
jgi:hypothetical protein